MRPFAALRRPFSPFAAERRAHSRQSCLMKRRIRDLSTPLVSLLLATAFWLPVVHVFFTPETAEAEAETVSPRARALLERQLSYWERDDGSQAELLALRWSNPEWDFMGRTFFVLALANMSLREPEERETYLGVIDRIIDETLESEAEHGAEHFLLPYWRLAPFEAQPARTLFVEGEIALMLGARLLVETRSDYRELLAERVSRILEQMERGPVLSGESYPNECWMFCNSVALAAIRISDAVTGGDHSEFLRRWVVTARAELVDEETGLLVSEFTYHGQHLDGPEGSSIFLVAHCLELVDPAFARGQYRRARELLAVEIAGFAYAREWPDTSTAMPDIDSGPVIPITGASAGASGMAILGAAAFGDESLLHGLLVSLDFAAFPIRDGEGLRYGASNQVGDAVLLYALVQGPLWELVSNDGGRV